MEMEEAGQIPTQNAQWYNKAHSYRKCTQRRNNRELSVPKYNRGMLIIDGAYFEQGTAKYLNDKYGISLFDSNSPELLIQNFIETIEEWLQISWIERHYINALFDESKKHKQLLDGQYAMIKALEEKCMFQIDWREFKKMSVYWTNRHWHNSYQPINRLVQAEVDVAIATKALSMAFQDKYDVLVVITGDRDFKDWFISVTTETNKFVQVIGFENTIWHEYYDTFNGIEVINAELLWDRAIGKLIMSQPITYSHRSEYSEECKNNYPSKQNNWKFNKNKRRNLSENNRTTSFNFNPKSKKIKRGYKYRNSKIKSINLLNLKSNWMKSIKLIILSIFLISSYQFKSKNKNRMEYAIKIYTKEKLR